MTAMVEVQSGETWTEDLSGLEMQCRETGGRKQPWDGSLFRGALFSVSTFRLHASPFTLQSYISPEISPCQGIDSKRGLPMLGGVSKMAEYSYFLLRTGVLPGSC